MGKGLIDGDGEISIIPHDLVSLNLSYFIEKGAYIWRKFQR